MSRGERPVLTGKSQNSFAPRVIVGQISCRRDYDLTSTPLLPQSRGKEVEDQEGNMERCLPSM